MERAGIVAGGNFIRDNTRIIDEYPAEEMLSSITGTDSGNGGAAYNVLKDLALLGADFPLFGIGLVGNDEYGKIILEDCKNHGIDTTRINTSGKAGTSFTDVMVSSRSGKRTFFHYRGANAILDIDHFDFRNLNALLFHFGYPMLLDTLDKLDIHRKARASVVLRKARETGLSVSMDLVSVNHPGYREVIYSNLPYIDYLFMNETETEKLTGIKINENDRAVIEKAVEAADLVLKRGVKTVICHFPEGAVAHSAGHTYPLGSIRIPQDKIAGSTGAGDALAAGFLLGIHKGKSIQDCLHLGICAATSSLLRANCSGGILPLEQCIELGRQFGFREIK